jgi:hypothetical protein
MRARVKWSFMLAKRESASRRYRRLACDSRTHVGRGTTKLVGRCRLPVAPACTYQSCQTLAFGDNCAISTVW